MKKTPVIFFNKYRIREACEIRSISMAQLASELRTSRVTLYAWIRDGFDYSDACRAAELLQFRFSDLCHRLGDSE